MEKKRPKDCTKCELIELNNRSINTQQQKQKEWKNLFDIRKNHLIYAKVINSIVTAKATIVKDKHYRMGDSCRSCRFKTSHSQ